MRLDKLEILRLVDEGFLMVNTHPDLPLQILNYTRKTQFEKAWNKYTLLSRGLIIDGDFETVAIPFMKFFNYEELLSPAGISYLKETYNLDSLHPISDYEIYDKMDGSLGILFNYVDTWHVATRGSFVSDQAIRAKSILTRHDLSKLNKDNTYLFEIIYPENRIVVNYDGAEKLVLLGIVDRVTGYDFTYDEMLAKIAVEAPSFEIVKRYDSVSDIDQLKARNVLNEEGYVMRKSGTDFRMKLKFEDYCRLHAIITNVSTKDIWECLRFGRDLNELLENTPDEFDEWVRTQVQLLRDDFNVVETSAKGSFNEIYSALDSKKEFAEKALKIGGQDSSILFKMYDGKPYDHIIWKMIEPKWSKPFFKNDENE